MAGTKRGQPAYYNEITGEASTTPKSGPGWVDISGYVDENSRDQLGKSLVSFPQYTGPNGQRYVVIPPNTPGYQEIVARINAMANAEEGQDAPSVVATPPAGASPARPFEVEIPGPETAERQRQLDIRNKYELALKQQEQLKTVLRNQIKAWGIGGYSADQVYAELSKRYGEGPTAAAFRELGMEPPPPIGINAPSGNNGGQSVSDPWMQFKQAFQKVIGRWPTFDDINNIGMLSQLSNDLVKLIPGDTLRKFDLGRLALLPNDFLVNNLPDIIPFFPDERLKGGSYSTPWGTVNAPGFSLDFLSQHISDPDRRINLGLPPSPGPAPTAPPPGSGPGPTAPPPPPPGGPTYNPKPGVSGAPPEGLPASHTWVMEIGASEWARQQRAAGANWSDITITKFREHTFSQWQQRAADPRFRAVYQYAQNYFAQTGWWPSEVELNKFTQNIPDAPNLSPDGNSLLPKGGSGSGGQKWIIPTGPDGLPQALPPGYEWRFTSDGVPVPFDVTPGDKDVFSGWFQNPQTGAWEYDPMTGAADYLTYNPQSQGRWRDYVNSFVNRTGRLPTLEEARNLAVQVWNEADPQARERAARFATLNGFWPTPYELEFGPVSSAGAGGAGGAGGGGAGGGAPSMGQVGVFIPGVGVVVTQGESLGPGGMVFDPFQGIPDSVRPWVREVLNGTIDKSQIPAGPLLDWVNFSIGKFKDNLPIKQPNEIPWGIPSIGAPPPSPIGPPSGGPGPGPGNPLGEIFDQAKFEDAWRQFGPGGPPPDKSKLNDIAFLSQLDNRIISALPSSVVRKMSNDVLARLPNDVLLNKLTIEELGRLPNERLLGMGQWAGAAFSLDVLARFPNERLQTFSNDILLQMPDDRLKTFSSDFLNTLIQDEKRREALGLPPLAGPRTGAETGQQLQGQQTSLVGGGPSPAGGPTPASGPGPTPAGGPGPTTIKEQQVAAPAPPPTPGVEVKVEAPSPVGTAAPTPAPAPTPTPIPTPGPGVTPSPTEPIPAPTMGQKEEKPKVKIEPLPIP